MAQVTITGPPSIMTTAHADANVVEYIFSPSTTRATITIEGQAGSVALTGTHGTPQTANRQPLTADIPFEVRLKQGPSRGAGAASLFVAVAVACDVTVVAEAG